MSAIVATHYTLVTLFFVVQIGYLLSLAVTFGFSLMTANYVTQEEIEAVRDEDCPDIVLFYPVLRELEGTMRTTFTSLSRIDYPADRFAVLAIPNENDVETVASLHRLQSEFAFLKIVEVPATSHPSWQPVWDSWEKNEKAYWWHIGLRAGNKDLPPKKTRQMVYAFYNLVKSRGPHRDFLVDYIDADSCPPMDHFRAGAAGMKRFDVLQAQNIAGNLNETLASSWHAADHMAWDGLNYPHITGNGKQPYWVLGKGLFFRASDLVQLGGFHPWITIEDPEVGMRFWKNGKKLGVIKNPLIEEVPLTFAHGITQRKRWVAGFFQSLTSPLTVMGFTKWEKLRAWFNFAPCLSLWINAVGLPIGLWAIWSYLNSGNELPFAAYVLAAVNLALFCIFLVRLYTSVWVRSRLVEASAIRRIWYLIRINPIALIIWWLIWLIPLFIGFRMYRKDQGLVWERTVKTNANETLIRGQVNSQS